MQVLPELELSWARAWRGVGALGDGLAVRNDLLARFAEKHRAYHTTQHLLECIQTYSAVEKSATHPAAVELALWFHDAIYDFDGKNEERSSVLAEQALMAAVAPANQIALVKSLILVTTHSGVPVTADEIAVVDVDLAILGAAATRFAEYEAQIRQEYRHIPEDQFVAGRKSVLESFLQRPRIYGSVSLFERLEAPARANLLRSLQALAGG